MEEDIEILEERIESIKYYDTYRYDWIETDIQLVENLIKGYRELEEKNKRYEKIYKEYGVDDLVRKIDELEEFKKQVTEIESTNFIKYKNYIPKSILEHKKQELEYDQLENPKNICENRIKIEFINELMEDK